MTGQEKLTYLDFCEAGSYMDFLLPIPPKTGIAVTKRWEQKTWQQRRSGNNCAWRPQGTVAACDRRQDLLPGDPEENERKLAKLVERFAHAYPYPGLQKLYTKVTVSGN